MVAFASTAGAAPPPSSDSIAYGPLSGIVQVGGMPVAGATVVVRCFCRGVQSGLEVLRSQADGTFVLPNARAGLYTVVSLVAGLPAASAKILHRPQPAVVSFVRLEVPTSPGVLPRSALGDADPWLARAIVRGDVLREAEAVLAELDGEPVAARLVSQRTAVPVKASVSSMRGFGATDGPNWSRASLDLAGSVGSSVRFGVEGQYGRGVYLDGITTADASRLSVDVDPGAEQRIRFSTRRQILPGDDGPTRFAAHDVDWSGATGERSRASVSARLVSQTNLLQSGPAAELFARESDAIEVRAHYQTELAGGHYLRVIAAYRSSTGLDTENASSPALERETRLGGSAGVRLLDVILFEGGATGDFSSRQHGITPEAGLTLEPGRGWKAFVFASRRWESRLDGALAGVAGTDDADLSRLSRAFYRAGLRYENERGEGLSLEATQRELTGTYRLFLDPDFLDRLDSLYFLSGDVAREFAVSTTFRAGRGLTGRLAARAGGVRGERLAIVHRDEATYSIAQAALRFDPSRTSIGVGYRAVTQSLSRGDIDLRNDVEAVDFSLAQTLPVPVLTELGSEWRALFNVEFGRRREGTDEGRSNRQMSGGLALSF